jgi:hypothetical protein
MKNSSNKLSKKKHSGNAIGPIVSAWEQDPGQGNQPDGGRLMQVEEPRMTSTGLPTYITNPKVAPPAKIYPLGSSEFRYWTAAEALTRASDFWSRHLPGTSWQVGKKLPIDLDGGEDLNAYYDRVGLKFFHGYAAGRTVYSGESPDVVCHELGHAILDAIKPQLWDAASFEAAAFHEAFGDMSSILCALQVSGLRQAVLAETSGSLYRSSRLSRLAEQLGWAIRQSYPNYVDPDCLRNAVNSFFYRNPATIPTSGPANILTSESHSFSRVFTGAFFEGLAGMFKLSATQNEQGLLQVSDHMATILVEAVTLAAVVPAFFSQVAANMIKVASNKFAGTGYDAELSRTFKKHGIIAASAYESLVAAPSSRSMSGVNAQNKKASKNAQLSVSYIDIKEYALGVDTIAVHSASDAKYFSVSGANLATGSATSLTSEEDAKSFVEHLIRKDKIRIPKDTRGMHSAHLAATTAAHSRYTHELKLERGGYMLRRLRIDCGF